MTKGFPVIAAALLMLVTTYLNAADHQFAASVENLKPYYLKEGIDLSVYSKVLVGNLKVGDSRVIAPPWYAANEKGAKKWELTDRDVEFLRQSYRAAMTQEIEKDDGYEVVETGGDGVIWLDMEIVTLMPYARKGEKVQVRGFGELRAQATLRDSVTGELLGIFEGPQQVGQEYQQNTRLNAENNLRALFEVWGSRMRRVMDDSRK
jgi:hypothetical protein